MTASIRSPKDFWAGTIYVIFGAVAVIIARDYTFGTGARMGPGYFPTVLGVLLMLLGGAAIVRSFLQPGEPIGGIAWKPLVLVVAATILFGFLLPLAGLAVALLALAIVSAAASRHFGFSLRAAIGLIALIAACGLVFVELLGVPMPLLGTFFTD